MTSQHASTPPTGKSVPPGYAKYESGQAIVIIALVLVGLIAALGLAIDGGGLYFMQRDLQNATDAAVVAATYARCTSAANLPPAQREAAIIQAAQQAAARNGFMNDRVGNWVDVYNPPREGAGSTNDFYVEVTVRAVKPPYFIQLVYSGPLEVTARAVGHCAPPFDPNTVGALFGIDLANRDCQNNVDWSGASGTIIGGIFSNNQIKLSGGGQSNAVEGGATAHGAVDWNAGNTTMTNPSVPVTGAPQRQDPLAVHFPHTDFAPGGRYARIAQNAGRYTHIVGNWRPNGTIEGLYYVEGNVDLNGVTYSSNGASIVATGDMSVRSIDQARYWNGGIPGFLLYTAELETNCGANAITISNIGSQHTQHLWTGIVYAPRGGVNFSSSSINMVGAVVATTINTSGSRMMLRYDPDILGPIPPLVEVAE